MSTDIQSIIKQKTDEAKRVPKGAIGGACLPELATNGSNKTVNKILPVLRRAKKMIDAGDYPSGAKLALRAINMDENCALANHVMAIALEKLGHLSKALEFYERAWRQDPNDGEVYQNLALVAWKLDMLPAAEKFLQLFLEISPGNVNGVINLSGVLRDQGRFEEAVELTRAAIYTHQDNAMLWNALATVLLESGDPFQAMTFYDEALRLDPDSARIWHNMAYAAGLAGDRELAASAGEKALAMSTVPEDRATIEYGLSQSCLALGQLEKGWRAHLSRFDPAGPSNMLYAIDAPRWDGEEDLTGKRVLLMGEQGLGDEVLYMNAAQDFMDAIGPNGRVDFAVERRLIGVVQRTYSPRKIMRHFNVNREGRQIRVIPDVKDWSAYDYYVPLGNAVAAQRKSLEDFPDHKGYLVPDPEKVKTMEKAVAALPAGPKIGLCWKSMVMNANRAKYFSPFDAWKPVLQTPGAVFVSMQYGDCAEEIAQAQKDLGVTIHELPGLDLKEDLDGVAAAGLALDLTIGPMNASTNLAAAHGGIVWFLASPDHWPLHSTGTIPWYPTSRVFSPEQFGKWDETMQRVAKTLGDVVGQRKVA